MAIDRPSKYDIPASIWMIFCSFGIAYHAVGVPHSLEFTRVLHATMSSAMCLWSAVTLVTYWIMWRARQRYWSDASTVVAHSCWFTSNLVALSLELGRLP